MRTEVVATKRRRSRLLADLERTRRPIAMTQHGIPSASLQEQMRLLEGIARGERAFREGRVLTQAQARRRMARWLK